MEKSIQHFNDVCVGFFDKLTAEFYKTPTDIAGFVKQVTDELHRWGLLLIQETLENMDQMIRESGKRKLSWVIEKEASKKHTTSLGTVCFRKTLFTNKKTGEMCYLLDRIMGIEKHERITDDAIAKLLEEAVQTSYRRGGEAASIMDDLSKQTVKNVIHGLRFPQGWVKPKEKRVVDYLYIEADEDHISLQYRDKKGDLTKSPKGGKNNGAITKLIYVHEGIEPDAPMSKRHHLINPHFFSRSAHGCSNEELWDTVYRYIDENYDLEKVKRVYVSSDGGGWIVGGMRRIAGVIHLLDQYHLEQHLSSLASHMLDDAAEARAELHRIICKGTKQAFVEYAWKLQGYLPEGSNVGRFEESRDYILNNWSAARYRLKKTEGKVGSSTEGHVSHVLSSRMSTAALGWSLRGADKMAQLRAYYLNGGDMLELARYQKEELPLVAGGEYQDYISPGRVITKTRNADRDLNRYYDQTQAHLALDVKKKLYLQEHIWTDI
ncbi:MAG: ISLre2 family transposase [Oscillospiraceae bacterium]|nr:ISLre2 family transposase [Oscillospiraceae bacterium]